MRFRWKLLILLLVISLLPMLVLRISAMRTMRQFRDTLVSQASTNLVAISESWLIFIADAFSLVLWKGRDNLETALIAQAVIDAAIAFRQPSKQEDDITLVVIKVKERSDEQIDATVNR